jgi:predicted DsbA family dithiol-disulfide isomerase
MDYERGLAANTLDAHRLLSLAEREHGAAVQREVAERLFAAHFAGGEDVSDPAVLARLAGEAGMDPGRVREYLVSDQGTAEVRAEIEDARRLGVTAVPTFVFEGRYAVQGAQPTSAFLRALETVERETAGAAARDAGDDACADGACSV